MYPHFCRENILFSSLLASSTSLPGHSVLNSVLQIIIIRRTMFSILTITMLFKKNTRDAYQYEGIHASSSYYWCPLWTNRQFLRRLQFILCLLFTAQNHKNIVVTQRGHMTMTCLVQKEPKSENLAKCFGESKSGDITDSIYRWVLTYNVSCLTIPATPEKCHH